MIMIKEEEEEALPRSLEPDMLILIFHKVPIRSVLRCKVVCKEWRRLISDPLFKSTYSIRVPTQLLNLLISPIPLAQRLRACTMLYEIDGGSNTSPSPSPLVGQPFPLPLNLNARLVALLGSCNGLVSLARLDSFAFPLIFWLLNPCTKEEKLVCVPPHEIGFYLGGYPVVAGLCHDPVTDEYKVVVTLSKPSDPFLLVSFKGEGKWKMKTKSPAEVALLESCDRLLSSTGTTFLGDPHWLCPDTGSVVYFDGRAEEYKMLKLPEGVQTEDWLWDDDLGKRKYFMKPAPACGLGVLDGKLTVALAVDGKGGQWCEVWELNNADSSWGLLFVMSGDSWRRFFEMPPIRHFKLLSWKKNEWAVFMFVRFAEFLTDELVVYDFRLRTFRSISLDAERVRSIMSGLLTYFPSLASPCSQS